MFERNYITRRETTLQRKGMFRAYIARRDNTNFYFTDAICCCHEAFALST